MLWPFSRTLKGNTCGEGAARRAQSWAIAGTATPCRVHAGRSPAERRAGAVASPAPRLPVHTGLPRGHQACDVLEAGFVCTHSQLALCRGTAAAMARHGVVPEGTVYSWAQTDDPSVDDQAVVLFVRLQQLHDCSSQDALKASDVKFTPYRKRIKLEARDAAAPAPARSSLRPAELCVLRQTLGRRRAGLRARGDRCRSVPDDTGGGVLLGDGGGAWAAVHRHRAHQGPHRRRAWGLRVWRGRRAICAQGSVPPPIPNSRACQPSAACTLKADKWLKWLDEDCFCLGKGKRVLPKRVERPVDEDLRLAGNAAFGRKHFDIACAFLLPAAAAAAAAAGEL